MEPIYKGLTEKAHNLSVAKNSNKSQSYMPVEHLKIVTLDSCMPCSPIPYSVVVLGAHHL